MQGKQLYSQTGKHLVDPSKSLRDLGLDNQSVVHLREPLEVRKQIVENLRVNRENISMSREIPRMHRRNNSLTTLRPI